MKNLIVFLFIFIFLSVNAQVNVNGYIKKDGTYVQPHVRTSPNSTPTDNYSYPGNTNPYTGKTATGNPSTYENKYKSNNSYNYNNTKDFVKINNLAIKANKSKTYLYSNPSENAEVVQILDYGSDLSLIEYFNEFWVKILYEYKNVYSQSKSIIGYAKNEDIQLESIYSDIVYYSTVNQPYGNGNGCVAVYSDCDDCEKILITINGGYVGEIYGSYKSKPYCGQKGLLNIILPEGNYYIEAMSYTLKEWKGQITIIKDKCYTFNLQKGSN